MSDKTNERVNIEELAGIMALMTKSGMIRTLTQNLKERDISLDSEDGMEKMFIGTIMIAKDMAKAVNDKNFANEYKKALLNILDL